MDNDVKELRVGVKAIDIAFEGAVANLNTKPLSSAALAGILRPMLGEVNMVSAPASRAGGSSTAGRSKG